MKSRDVLLALTMVSALALTACGGAAKSAAPPAAGQPAVSAAAAQSPMATGVANMRQVMADTQKAVSAGDAAKAQTLAEGIDEAWEKFEDQAKDKNKDLYAKIEEQIQLIQAATKASPVDSKVVGDAATKLNGLLDDLLK